MTWLFMAMAGGVGALARFELATRVAARHPGHFPMGTLVVNSIGSLLAGVAFAARLDDSWDQVLVTGFLGGFTTFSTWMVETARLLEDEPSIVAGLANLGIMLATGVTGAAIGMSLGR